MTKGLIFHYALHLFANALLSFIFCCFLHTILTISASKVCHCQLYSTNFNKSQAFVTSRSFLKSAYTASLVSIQMHLFFLLKHVQIGSQIKLLNLGFSIHRGHSLLLPLSQKEFKHLLSISVLQDENWRVFLLEKEAKASLSSQSLDKTNRNCLLYLQCREDGLGIEAVEEEPGMCHMRNFTLIAKNNPYQQVSVWGKGEKGTLLLFW